MEAGVSLGGKDVKQVSLFLFTVNPHLHHSNSTTIIAYFEFTNDPKFCIMYTKGKAEMFAVPYLVLRLIITSNSLLT